MAEKETPPEIENKLIELLSRLKSQGLTSQDILSMINKWLKVPAKEEVNIPISVFKNDKLSCLETIVKYLRENKLLAFKQIGSLTNRNEVALAVTCSNARKKLEAKFAEEISPYAIPVSILKDRNLSVLENVVSYLKDTFGLTYHSIAVLLNRDDRTIWTVYQRARKKRK